MEGEGAHKVCVKCKEDKPLTEFYSCSHNKDGAASECKACNRERSRNIARRKRAARKEAAAAGFRPTAESPLSEEAIETL